MRGAEESIVQFMDRSVKNNTWHRRQYGAVYGDRSQIMRGQKTVWCNLWIERSQIVRGTEDSMVQFMGRSQIMRGAEENMVQFMDLSVTNNAWHRRQYGTVYGSIGHK